MNLQTLAVMAPIVLIAIGGLTVVYFGWQGLRRIKQWVG